MNETIARLFACYTNTMLSSIGFICSIICFIIFNNSMFKLNFYGYFKMEVLFISFDLLLSITTILIDCNDIQIRYEYFSNVYRIYFIAYLKSVMEFSINIYSLLGTLAFYSKIDGSNFMIKLNNKSYKTICSIAFIVSILMFIFRAFDFKIVEYHSKISNTSLFITDKSDFSHTKFSIIINIVTFAIRDLFYVLILIVLNTLIFLKVKKLIKRKRTIRATTSDSNNEINIKTSLLSVKIMVIAGNINNLFGRIPILLNLILDSSINDYKSKQFGIILFHLTIFTVYASYIVKFILYYVTNKNFRLLISNYALKILNKAKSCS
jgi:hypothetical protein